MKNAVLSVLIIAVSNGPYGTAPYVDRYHNPQASR